MFSNVLWVYTIRSNGDQRSRLTGLPLADDRVPAAVVLNLGVEDSY